jgi:hypothetical protein
MSWLHTARYAFLVFLLVFAASGAWLGRNKS